MREDDLAQSEKKYIEVQYSDESQNFLRNFCQENDFDLTTKFNGGTQAPEDFDFHSTVWFTTSEHDLHNTAHNISIEDFEAVQYSLFGPDENILVLEVTSDHLSGVRNMFGEKYDMTDEWPDYKPHITLSYSFNGDIPDIPLPDLSSLVADKLSIKTQS